MVRTLAGSTVHLFIVLSLVVLGMIVYQASQARVHPLPTAPVSSHGY